jgi:hypothetical protein
MTRTVITLRARSCGTPPRPGDLMAAETGPAVYRLEAVTTLRQAGERPGAHRYRLTCTRLEPAAVPQGAAIHPWRCGSPVPRQTAPLAATPVPWVAVAPKRLQARPVAVSDAAGGADFGPGIRRKAVRDRRGRLLREPDVEVEEQAVDPRYPNRYVRRARRVDTIDLLRRAGTIGAREVEAAGDLRQALERIARSAASAGQTGTATSSSIEPIMDTHLKAAKKLREASAALGGRLWHPVLWVCLGGSVRGYAAQWRVGTHRAAEMVGNGLVLLGDHFYGAARA